MNTPNYSKLQMGALVIMRVAIGWHFLFEGIAKLLKPDWSAAGFLLQSKWIFAPVFQWMANDPAILSVVNFMNIWGLILIGLGLMVGLFVRWASLAGILLIALYYFCNPPFVGLYYSIPSEGNYLIVNKNFVEMTALFVLFVLPSSHVYGLDALVSKLRKK